jgi:hypothetical protein
VYGVTKNVSTASRAVRIFLTFVLFGVALNFNATQTAASFTNQALKGVPQNYQVELLDKFQSVTKEAVLDTLKTYFLPLFDSSSSIATVVTAPGKAESISDALRQSGFEVENRSLHVDSSEMIEEDSESDSEDGSEADSEPSR